MTYGKFFFVNSVLQKSDNQQTFRQVRHIDTNNRYSWYFKCKIMHGVSEAVLILCNWVSLYQQPVPNHICISKDFHGAC